MDQEALGDLNGRIFCLGAASRLAIGFGVWCTAFGLLRTARRFAGRVAGWPAPGPGAFAQITVADDAGGQEAVIET